MSAFAQLPELAPADLRSIIADALTGIDLEEVANVSDLRSLTAKCGGVAFALQIDAFEAPERDTGVVGGFPTSEGVRYEVTIEMAIRRTGTIATDKVAALNRWNDARKAVNLALRQQNRVDLAFDWKRSPRARILSGDWLQQDMVFHVHNWLDME